MLYVINIMDSFVETTVFGPNNRIENVKKWLKAGPRK
jgi:acylphosphatase